MNPSILHATISTITRTVEKIIRLEYCTVLEVDAKQNPGVQNHSVPVPHFFNTCSIKARIIRQNQHMDPEATPQQCEHLNCIVLQRDIGNCFGQPWTPRVGDLVAVLFIYNTLPIILGTLVTFSQPPVCRGPADPIDGQYDRVDKFCQWQRPQFDRDLNAYDHPEGRMPVCEKLFHGYPTGEAGHGRDWQHVFDCRKGDKDPTCKDCISIDSVPRCSEGWVKVYSEETESCESPPKRMEVHAKCGSHMRIESECGVSKEYSEGTGHIVLENALIESERKFHLNVQGKSVSGCEGMGTFDAHTNYSGLPLKDEFEGVRFAGVRPTDMQVTWAWEAMDFTTNSFIRCYKDGRIEINSNNNGAHVIVDGPHKEIEICGIDNVGVRANQTITLDAPLVHVTGNCQIDGYCHHNECTCDEEDSNPTP